MWLLVNLELHMCFPFVFIGKYWSSVHFLIKQLECKVSYVLHIRDKDLPICLEPQGEVLEYHTVFMGI